MTICERPFVNCIYISKRKIYQDVTEFVTLVQSVENEQTEATSTENLPSSLDIKQLSAAVKVH